jgi:hypothetical protein
MALLVLATAATRTRLVATHSWPRRHRHRNDVVDIRRRLFMVETKLLERFIGVCHADFGKSVDGVFLTDGFELLGGEQAAVAIEERDHRPRRRGGDLHVALRERAVCAIPLAVL